MIVRVSTELETSPERAWEAVNKAETLLYITRGLLGIRPLGHVPERFEQDTVVPVRLYFFHVIPAWRHEIRFVRHDEAAREIYTQEHGGPVRNWNHLIKIEPLLAGGTSGGQPRHRCLYTDEIEIRAGPLTALVWLYAHGFYRYRQRRWRKLARRLESSEAGSSPGR